MADNVAVTAGSGTTIAADEVVDGTLGTVKVQYVKIMDGTLDSTTKAAVGAAGLKVDLSSTAANATAVKVDGSAVTQPVSGTVTANAGTGSFTVAQATAANLNATVAGTVTANIGTAGTLALDATLTGGTQKTKLVDTGGTNVGTIRAASSGAAVATDTALVVTVRDANANGQAAMSASAPVVIASDQSAIKTIAQTSTTGGATPAHYLSAASTNATSTKASAGTVYGIVAVNTTGTVYYLKLYNKASAPTVGTDVPVLTIPVPASTSGAGINLMWPMGVAFTTGIAWALTGAAADADATAAATGVTINLVYA